MYDAADVKKLISENALKKLQEVDQVRDQHSILNIITLTLQMLRSP